MQTRRVDSIHTRHTVGNAPISWRDLLWSAGFAVPGPGAAIGGAAALSGLGVGGHLAVRRVDNERGTVIDHHVGDALGTVGCASALIDLHVPEGSHKEPVRPGGVAARVG